LDDSEVFDYVDLFKLDRMIVEAIYRMSHFRTLNFTEQCPEDPNLLFILNNILDDQFIIEESFYDIIKEDIYLKSRYIEGLSSSICFILLAISVVLYAFMVTKELKLICFRSSLAESFGKITQLDLEHHLQKVLNFMELYENKQNATSALFSKMNKEAKTRILDTKTAKEERGAGLNQTKLNFRIYILLLLILLMEVLVVGISYLNFLLTQSNQNEISLHVGNSVHAGNLNANMIVLAVGLYPYMLSNGAATLKNKPFNEVWREIVEEAGSSQDFYLSLLGQLDQDLAGRLRAMYSQDLCEIIITDECFEPIRPILQGVRLRYTHFF
jgi:hypothetical protein